MHEVGIMQSVLDTVMARAQASQAVRVEAINLRIGVLSGVVPEALAFAFEALKKDTPAAEAQLNVDYVPVQCFCKNCSTIFRSENYSCECPACHREDIEIRSGRELDLVSIEVS